MNSDLERNESIPLTDAYNNDKFYDPGGFLHLLEQNQLKDEAFPYPILPASSIRDK
jgi:hypothetical protein